MTPNSLEKSGPAPPGGAARERPAATLPSLFESQVAGAADAIAVICGVQSLSYGELDARANRLAHHLIALGVGPDDLVAVALDRSVELIVALTAILKSGAAYLPLDPSHPAERLVLMLEDSGARFTLTLGAATDRLRGRAQLLALDDPGVEAAVAGRPAHAPTDVDRRRPLHPDHLAYVIYTSGSAGRPKGVLTTQANVASVVSRPAYAPLGPGQSVLQYAPVAFDAATFEIWGALLNGARLVLAPNGYPDLDRLAQTIAAHSVDTLWLTAGLFAQAADTHPHLLAPVRRLLSGGDALSVSAVARTRATHPGLTLINGYGPTETTVFACTHEIEPRDAEAERIPIGRPIQAARVFVLDERLLEVPYGAQGELYIAGAGLARGYLNQPGLTAERFVACPFGPPGTRMYRTGDLARRRVDGTLEFLGRADRQIKIRGFRIEPGEIEAALEVLDGVGQASVIPFEIAGETRLVAYVVARTGARLTRVADIRAALSLRLPDHMVPAAFVVLDALPLTANGKLDRGALPRPDQPTCVAARPLTGTERRLAVIWGDLLGLGAIDATADFFALGGHSLLAIRLCVAVEAAFGRRIDPAVLFHAPTLESFARAVDGSAAAPPAATPSAGGGRGGFDARAAVRLAVLRKARGVSRGAVVGMPSLNGGGFQNRVSAANAFEDFDVWTFTVEAGGRDLTQDGIWIQSAREIADRLLATDGLRPVALFGYSMAGFMAWLVDRLLVAAGRPSTPVINIDGEPLHIEQKGWAERIGALTPFGSALDPERMLLLHRGSPGGFALKGNADAGWSKAGVAPKTLSFRTIDHSDMTLPEALGAGRDAVSAFIETGRLDPGPGPARYHFDTLGGTLYRLLSDPAPPLVDSIRPLLLGTPLPDDVTARKGLLVLAIATGDAELALTCASRWIADEPENRTAIYAQVALLADVGRRDEALAIAYAPRPGHPLDRAIAARAQATTQRPASWGSAGGLVLGAPHSLDFAVALRRVRTPAGAKG